MATLQQGLDVARAQDFWVRLRGEGHSEREMSESEVLGITGMLIDTILSYWNDVVIGGCGICLHYNELVPCVWRESSNRKSR